MNIRIIFISFLFCSIAVSAQTGKQKLDKAKKDANAERQRAFGGQRDKSNYNIEKQLSPSDEKVKASDTFPQPGDDAKQQGEKSSKEVIKRNEDQPTAKNKTSDSSVQSPSTSPQAVIQRTSSESGSPSVLSKNDGRGRDGTNNVQRSSYNVAGSPLQGNFNLDKKNRGEKNQNIDSLRVRKQEEQPGVGTAKASDNKKGERAKAEGSGKGNSNAKSRRQKG